MPSRSVGFIGPDRPPPDEALRAARRRGLELSTHRSRVVEERDLQETDLVVLMDPSHGRRLTRHSGRFRAPVIALGDLDPEYDPPSRTIRDPWGRPPEFFEDVFSRIDRCLAELTGALGYPTKGNRNAEDASPTAKDGR